jgi:uncharacterized protein YndB with AHSA1/START domain
MVTLDQATVTDAAPEEVWKLLYDPARLPDWWAGAEPCDPGFAWQLRPLGTGTEISVHVEIPEAEADRLGSQREVIRLSLLRLAAMAERQG